MKSETFKPPKVLKEDKMESMEANSPLSQEVEVDIISSDDEGERKAPLTRQDAMPIVAPGSFSQFFVLINF